MHRYQIAPNLIRLKQDAALVNDFTALCSRPNWKYLVRNVEVLEEMQYMYFRISLIPCTDSSTFAGFESGAPFFIDREEEERKIGLFIRHWVRRASADDIPADLQVSSLEHLAVAFRNGQLLVRVNFNRSVVPEETIDSVQFATWMFQIVQVDAIIEGVREVRFAFGMERTMTNDEHDLIKQAGFQPPKRR